MKHYAALTVAVATLIGSLVFTASAQFTNPGASGGGGGGLTSPFTAAQELEWTGRAILSSPADNLTKQTSNDGTTGFVTSSATADTMTVYAADGTSAGDVIVTGKIRGTTGSDRALPDYTFAGDPDSGIGHDAAGNAMFWSAGGVAKLLVSPGVFSITDKVTVQSSIRGNSDTLYVGQNKTCTKALAAANTDMCVERHLEVDGSTHIAGGTTHVGDHAYRGEMYRVDDPNATTISGADTWYEVDNFQSGVLDGATHATGDLTITNAGDYLVTASFSASGTNANIYWFGISVDDVIQDKCRVRRTIGSAGAHGVGSISCVLTLTASQVLKFEVLNDDAANNATVTDANITATQL